MLSGWTLDDRYRQHEGRHFLSGTQALVKLPLLQRELDRRNGLSTAGFISGYRGSPLGGYDAELWRSAEVLRRNDIVFQPGLNEELAATSVWGAQQANILPDMRPRHDGVFGIWYGKGPGVDRCGDVFKHANLEGTAAHGGVLALAGDDHAGKSSTLAHQSEQAFIAAGMPVLHPTSLHDYLRLGLFGWALSRAAGVWVGFKCVTDVVETSGTTAFSFDDVNFTALDGLIQPEFRVSRGPVNVLGEEAALYRHRLPAALAFVRANPVDETVIAPERKRLGILAVGKALTDTREALRDLGLDETGARRHGIGLYAVRLSWPIEAEGLKRFASGFEELLIVEEKRDLVEQQVKAALYSLPARDRPEIMGKACLPDCGELSPAIVRAALLDRMTVLGIADSSLQALRDGLRERERGPLLNSRPPSRTPAFCSGCPHNRSTRIPDGSVALAGIGCHVLAMFMPDRPTQRPTQMGGEGANWIGMAPFVERPHVFQNLGDGTYFHSGILAVRAAVAARIPITYKILFNDAVAMTGGQPVEGELTVPRVLAQLRAEGVGRTVLVTDDVERYRDRDALPPAAEVRDRRDLLAIESELAATPGVTAIVYEQTCAAEKRRRRKRGRLADPPKRLFINPAVCEGCGDCSVQSNCVSIEPAPTPFGVKRRINQSSCNKDYSCAEGFCPSFVTVIGGQPRKAAAASRAATDVAHLSEPVLPALDQPFDILVTGIGGTGVITIGALIGVAAQLAGKAALLLDWTGLSQKNGSVYSHVRLAENDRDLHGARVGPGRADALIGCDLLVSAAPEALMTYSERTRVALNDHVVPTAAFQRDRDMALGGDVARAAIDAEAGADAVVFDATALAERHFGNAMLANVILLGAAWQRGLVPLPLAALRQAIVLNGVAVAENGAAFDLGRSAAVAPTPPVAVAPLAARPERLADIVERHHAHLTAYQNRAWADRYAGFVTMVAAREEQVAAGSTVLAEAVARNLGKLMAYKDEYEVARLHRAGLPAMLAAQFEGVRAVRYNLAPPLFARRDPYTGHLRKREFGAWVGPLFAVLARARALRGTWADPFGYIAERRAERALIAEYRDAIERLLEHLESATLAEAVRIAALPDAVRGFGHVKERAVAAYRQALASGLAAMTSRADQVEHLPGKDLVDA